eukprot:2856402-Pyramimonas_sp.AAC.1
MHAEHPEEDVRDLKALLRYDKLKKEGISVVSAVEVPARGRAAGGGRRLQALRPAPATVGGPL